MRSQPFLKRRRKYNRKHLIPRLMWSGKGTTPPPPITVVEGVVQAQLNEERLHRTWELNLRVHGLPPPEAPFDPLQIDTSFLHDTLDLKDLTLERAWMGPNSTLFLRFRTLEDRLRALRAKRKLSSLPPTQKIFLDADLTKSQQTNSNCLGTKSQQRRKKVNGLLLETSKQSSMIRPL
jgi:hypothetical protein